MKKIFSILCMLAMTLSFVACSDDNDEGAAYNRPSSISIVKSDVLFSANAGTGYVQVSTGAPLIVEGGNDWCDAKVVSDSTVEVSVNNNEGIDGRSCILTLKSGVDSVNVTVQQQGFIFSLTGVTSALSCGDAATTKRFALKTNGTPSVVADADWVIASIVEDSLQIGVKANATGHLRQANVKISFGEFTDSIKVSQYDFKKDIAGDYYLAYYDADGKLSAFSAELTTSGNQYTMTLPELGLTLPVNFDEKACQLNIAAGSYMGPFSSQGTTLYIYALLGSMTTGNLTWSPALKLYADFSYSDDEGTMAYFDTTGTYNYLSFFVFSDKTLSGDTALGYLENLFSPFLMKIDDAAAAKNGIVVKKGLKFGK